MVDLSQLNPQQRDAASHGDGPILVLAGAGSGKTRVITFRIAHLLARGVPAKAICAVTFTNKAAEEMRDRVAQLVRDRKVSDELTIGTFHALGLQILRSERAALGLPRGFAIYDQSDSLGAVREAMRGLRDGDRRYDAKAIATRISLAKNAFVAPDDYEGNSADDYDALTVEIYPRYQAALRACAAFDFDDLVCEPVRLFARDADVGARWAARFRFVMVDEFQDTNRAQLRMVQHLVRDHRNLCVVGDDDQSIYSWRGADPTNILEFARLFPGAKIVKLEQNYRSTTTILAAANEVIANNKDRHGKKLWSKIAGGGPIIHAVAHAAEDEARWVAREICGLRERDRLAWSDIAVMYRSNVQAKLVEDELRQASVPYVMYGGQQFFERKEVKDVMAYVRVALNRRDELALRRVLNYPARGIGAMTIERAVAHAHARRAPLWDALGELDAAGPARAGIASFRRVIDKLGAALDAGTDPVDATRALIEDVKLYDDLRDAAGSLSAAQRRIDNVESLLAGIARAHARHTPLGDYLKALALDTSSDDRTADGGDKVVLVTLHGAKGLEFPVCFMIGLEEELLPHARTLNPIATDVTDAEHAVDISEERRLCYVGITRAQRKLYVTRACTRVTRGRTVQRTPSRFLLEIPDDLLEVRDLAEEARQRVPADELRSFFASFAVEE